eukprot:834094-Rhodomonas_salina.2
MQLVESAQVEVLGGLVELFACELAEHLPMPGTHRGVSQIGNQRQGRLIAALSGLVPDMGFGNGQDDWEGSDVGGQVQGTP